MPTGASRKSAPGEPAGEKTTTSIPVCSCGPKTPVRDLCVQCRDKRRRVRDRLNRREDKGRPAGVAYLPPDIVADLTETLDALDELTAELTEATRTPEVDQYVYAIRQLRRILQPALDVAEQERIEIERPTTRNPDTYKPKRTKAIGAPGRHGKST